MGHVGSEFPDWGLKLGSLHWERRVLTTGPPGKSLGTSILTRVQLPLKFTRISDLELCLVSMQQHVGHFCPLNEYDDRIYNVKVTVLLINYYLSMLNMC